MPLTVSALVIAHDPDRAAWLRDAVASAVTAGADEVLVVRPFRAAIEGQEGRYRDVPTTDATLAGKQADGVDAAAGEVVAFLDDDDLWKPEKVAVVRERFAARPELVLLNHAYDEIDESGRPRGPGRPSEGRWTLSSNLALRRSWALRQTALARAAGWEADETWEFAADLDAPRGVEVLDRSLTLWRYHEGNVSKSHWTSAAAFRATQTRLYERWVRAETAMLEYAARRSAPPDAPPVVRRRRRLAKFTFLLALERGPGARSAARRYRTGPDAEPELRRLAMLAEIAPSLARLALYRFNRFH